MTWYDFVKTEILTLSEPSLSWQKRSCNGATVVTLLRLRPAPFVRLQQLSVGVAAVAPQAMKLLSLSDLTDSTWMSL